MDAVSAAPCGWVEATGWYPKFMPEADAVMRTAALATMTAPKAKPAIRR